MAPFTTSSVTTRFLALSERGLRGGGVVDQLYDRVTFPIATPGYRFIGYPGGSECKNGLSPQKAANFRKTVPLSDDSKGWCSHKPSPFARQESESFGVLRGAFQSPPKRGAWGQRPQAAGGSHDLSPGLNTSAVIQPKNIAAEIPAAAAVSPPVRAPSQCRSSTAFFTPLARL